MIFEEMSRSNQEKFLMPVLIKALQHLGGKSTRKELKEEIKTSVIEIPESIIDEVKPAKNGGFYHPFDFVFNFSITNLEMANFLKCQPKGEVILTEKGRMCDILSMDVDKDIYTYSKPAWEKRRNKKSKKASLCDLDDKNQIENDVSEQWKSNLKQILLSMNPKKFEIFCRALVKRMGVDIDEKKGVLATRDGGIDGYGYITSDDFRTSRVAIQAKRWGDKQKVGTPEIDQFVGAMFHNNAEFGIFITTTEFTRDAIERARSGQRAVTLINGDKIIELVEKYQLYIKPVTTYELETFYTEEN